jgi:hypothetical protein
MAQAQRRQQRIGLHVDGRFQNMEEKKEFIRAATRVRSAIFGNEYEDRDVDSNKMWVNAINKICDVQNIVIDVRILRSGSPKTWKYTADRINTVLSSLEEEIRISEAITNDLSYIELDDNWKSRAGSYISHIREVVSKAEVIEPLRERIFKRLNQLQDEIDKNRTRVESISEVFLAITEAVGKGAKHLEGAVKLIERLAGAFSGARTARLEHDTQLRLPGPDNLGLAEPDPTGEITSGEN